MSFKQANKIHRLESANRRLVKQNLSLIDEVENLQIQLEKSENRIKEGSQEIREMIDELKAKQDKVDEEYQKIFQMRQDYEKTVIEIKKAKDNAFKDYEKILDEAKR